MPSLTNLPDQTSDFNLVIELPELLEFLFFTRKDSWERGAGRDVMIDSPSEIAAEQLEELYLKIVEAKKEE